MDIVEIQEVCQEQQRQQTLALRDFWGIDYTNFTVTFTTTESE